MPNPLLDFENKLIKDITNVIMKNRDSYNAVFPNLDGFPIAIIHTLIGLALIQAKHCDDVNEFEDNFMFNEVLKSFEEFKIIENAFEDFEKMKEMRQ